MTRRKVAHERRQQIIAGLYECLAKNGHEKVTIKDIARAANVSYGVLHYYFNSKKDIVLALVEDYLKQHESLWEELANPIHSPWERFRMFISFAVKELIFEQKTSMVFLNLYQMGCHDEDIRSSLMESYEHLRKAVRDTVEYGISQGEFANVDPEAFALLLAGCIEGIFLQIAMDPTLCDQETIENLIYENFRPQLDPKQKRSSQ